MTPSYRSVCLLSILTQNQPAHQFSSSSKAGNVHGKLACITLSMLVIEAFYNVIRGVGTGTEQCFGGSRQNEICQTCTTVGCTNLNS